MRWAWAVLAVCGLAFAGDGDEDGRQDPPKPAGRPFTQRDLEEMQRGGYTIAQDRDSCINGFSINLLTRALSHP